MAVYQFMSKSRVPPERDVRVKAVLAMGCRGWSIQTMQLSYHSLLALSLTDQNIDLSQRLLQYITITLQTLNKHCTANY